MVILALLAPSILMVFASNRFKRFHALASSEYFVCGFGDLSSALVISADIEN